MPISNPGPSGLFFTELCNNAMAYAAGKPLSTWTDLDLSAYAPAGATAVLLRALMASAAVEAGFRAKGSACVRYSTIQNLQGENQAFLATNVDLNRIVQYWTNNTSFGVQIWGYWKPQ